ncbi:MAG TPA: ABC transporter permease [Prolixibacteraceae bacterium]|nr:ABC transporter permease [Prolixibacteraceae bacterium]
MQYIFKTSYRNFVRRPVTNLINLLGLAVSLALVIFLSVYSYSELTTDNYHENGDRVYLLAELGSKMYTPGILKDQIDLNVPEVESSVRMASTWETPVFQAGEHDPISSDIVFGDIDFFKLFSYQPAEGNLETSLKEPMSIVLTQSLAKKLFGNEPALGKTVKLNNDRELTVSAVIKEPAANSSLSFSALASIDTRKIVLPNGGEFTEWGWNNFQTFLLLKKGANPDETAKKIIALFPKDDQANQLAFKLNLFKKVYFSNFSISGSNYLRCGNKREVMILMMVAALVLVIALVNFINISSSQWLEKIRQTGVLKVIGANKTRILWNVFFEAFLLFLMSLFIAIFIAHIMFPIITSYTGIHFKLQLLSKPSFLMISLAGTFILSLIFSIIPAMRISSSRAVDNLNKTIRTGSLNSFYRGILVTTQFVIAIVLIAFTVLVQKQVNFGSSNLGFNQENIIGIKLTPQLKGKKEMLKKLLQDKPTVGKISFTQYYPGTQLNHGYTSQKVDGQEKELNFDFFNADANFGQMLGLQLTQGRFFSEDLTTDQHKMVVNESFLRENKMDNPIGAKFMMGFGIDPSLSEIIGVVKDFHYKSVNQPIVALIIHNEPTTSYCLFRLQTTDFKSLHQSIQEIKTATAELSPSFPVEISFFDQAIENMYQSELQFRRTFSLFAGCAIVICCLGILAMSLFTCQRRIKEIGIRKVNGAKVSEILSMLNKDFVKWVAIAFLIATPIAYFAMNKWLENFAYKTNLSWWIFALSGMLALSIALLTVSWQSWKAATRNPVEALRYE